ncbi:MAG: hypothetical protein H6754_04195 [Candidatus Omnitrophica bacterium]|nr:hypothetical protein [Candidatus Omnitrophota bacterium]
MNNRHFLSTLTFIAIVLGASVSAQASMDFSVVPVDGGSTIRFGRGDLNSGVTKNVRIRITSNDNTQYQVFQQLISPFTNERGVTIDRPVLTASILAGSSGSGTVYLSSYEGLSRGEQLLYTSSAAGMSESFTIVYNVDTRYLTDSGSFNGLIQYTLRPVSGGQRQTVQTNVFIESNAELTVDAQGSAGINKVRIDSRENSAPAYINFKFSGNAGGTLKVYQEVLTYPINDLNSELDSGILSMSFTGGQQGELSSQNTVDLPRNRALIYKSTQQSDSFSISFSLPRDKLANLMAGSYRGVIRFVFETDRVVKSFDIDLDIKISPLFEIALSFPQGSINFNGIVPGSDPQIKEVDVEVRTNLHRPYIVKQMVGDLLVNEKGKSIPKKYFVFRQEIDGTNTGKIANTEFQPVEPGETEIFYSDRNGSPAKFKVYYRLSPYAQMQAGDYKTSMIYDLGQL